MNFQMSGRKPDSVMWEHFSKPVDENGVEDFRKAKCHHCTVPPPPPADPETLGCSAASASMRRRACFCKF